MKLKDLNILFIVCLLLVIAFWITVVLILPGCVCIDYGNFHYRSFGGRTFDRLEGIKDGNDVLVDVRNYKSESITDALREVKETIQAVK